MIVIVNCNVLSVNLGCLVLQALLEHWPPTFVCSGEKIVIFSGFVFSVKGPQLRSCVAANSCHCVIHVTNSFTISFPFFLSLQNELYCVEYDIKLRSSQLVTHVLTLLFYLFLMLNNMRFLHV